MLSYYNSYQSFVSSVDRLIITFKVLLTLCILLFISYLDYISLCFVTETIFENLNGMATEEPINGVSSVSSY